jgi:hypothetical protein
MSRSRLSSVDVWSSTRKKEKPGPSFSSENTPQKMFIVTDKISEIVNDPGSDGGSFSELSDSDMCKVSTPFGGSSIEKEEVVQPEPDRGRKRNRRTLPKLTNTDFEFFFSCCIPAVCINNKVVLN